MWSERGKDVTVIKMHCRMASTKAPDTFGLKMGHKNAALNVYLEVLKYMIDYLWFITQNTTKYLYKTGKKMSISIHK